MLLLGWLLPLLLITFVFLHLVSAMISGQIEKTVSISADKAVEICGIQMTELVTASKNASYISTIEDSYQAYHLDGNAQAMYNSVTGFLNEQYKYNPGCLCAMVFFLEMPETVYYTYNTYQDNNMGTSGYARVRYFQENVQQELLDGLEDLDTGTELRVVDGHVYMVRNLMDHGFRPYGMIVMELEPGNIFDSLESIWGALSYEVFVDGIPMLGASVGDEFDMTRLENPTQKSMYSSTRRQAYVYHVSEESGQRIAYLVQLDAKSIIDDLAMLRYLFLLVLVFTIPLIYMIVKFFMIKVNRPVERLVNAAREIASGNYGTTVAEEGSSEEFSHLERAFNTMSEELKYSFEKIYLEELALRDANIEALQSQINPHFLNNTLEIINWEARMNGNDNVSAMIEALATMLNATMNREQKRFVPLREELTYVDAYLYVIGRRFGERFHVKREIAEELLEVPIPILMIQPIVENAVEHGVACSREGTVILRIYHRDTTMYIEVVNDSELTEMDRIRIESLLGESEEQVDKRHVSLGIRNVNRRLKIIYGERYGLTIRGEKGCTVSTLTVEMRGQEPEEKVRKESANPGKEKQEKPKNHKIDNKV